MNSDPLSESMPMIGNGDTTCTCMRASNTHFAALLRIDRFTVHPVAMSVTVRVKHAHRTRFRPHDRPDRSPRTRAPRRPGSPRCEIGICDFNSVPGFVCDRPSETSFSRSGASRFPVGARNTAQHFTRAAVISGLYVAGRARARRHDLQHQGLPQRRQRMITMPPRQLDELVQDPPLHRPARAAIRQCLLLRDRLPLQHRELHGNRLNPARHSQPSPAPVSGGNQMRQRSTQPEVLT